jgi:hypothetical protein
VGTVVGMAGLGVTAVGAITKNKDLLKAGKIMGFVGLGMGVTGWAVGALNSAGAFGTAAADSADDLAAGSLDDMVGMTDDAIGDMQGMTKEAIKDLGGIRAEAIKELGQPLEALQGGTPTQVATPAMKPVTQGEYLNVASAAPPAAPAPTPQAQPAPQAPVASGMPTLQPTPGVINGTSSRLDFGVNPLTGTNFTAPPPPAGGGASGVAGWFGSLPDWAKTNLVFSGGQAIAGAAGGYFQGLSAEEELEFKKQVEAWRQKNASYAPRLSFAPRTGVIGGG